jgi:guanylate kinase
MKNPKNLKDYPLVAFILTGITGAGKGTLVKFLMRLFPQIFAFSVSWTTRPRREGEIEGKHYFYRNHDQFSEHADKGGFFEWKSVYRSQKGSTGAPNKYGTPLSEIRRILGEGKIPLLDIDPKGALDVKKRFRNAHTVFITPLMNLIYAPSSLPVFFFSICKSVSPNL